MPKPHQRTRSSKRRQVRLPSGSSTIHFSKKRTKAARCLGCQQPIFGVLSRNASRLRRISLSEKRPQRMFGGQLCSTCLKKFLKYAARSSSSA